MSRANRFCGISMSLADYDDNLALRAYVWSYGRHLMTPLERRVTEHSLPILSNSTHWQAQKLYALLEERDGHVDDAEVVEAFEQP
jgi:hypothetical protein